jgi:iron-sulfur cluster assembly protein
MTDAIAAGDADGTTAASVSMIWRQEPIDGPVCSLLIKEISACCSSARSARPDRVAGSRPKKSSEAGSGRPAVGRPRSLPGPTVEELLMLTLTDGAVSAIRSLTSQPELPVQTGLRIVAQGDGEASFQLALAEGPVAGDQVVEEGGARVFVEPAAAAVLEDKALDAQVNEQGRVAFSVSDQAHRA